MCKNNADIKVWRVSHWSPGNVQEVYVGADNSDIATCIAEDYTGRKCNEVKQMPYWAYVYGVLYTEEYEY